MDTCRGLYEMGTLYVKSWTGRFFSKCQRNDTAVQRLTENCTSHLAQLVVI